MLQKYSYHQMKNLLFTENSNITTRFNLIITYFINLFLAKKYFKLKSFVYIVFVKRVHFWLHFVFIWLVKYFYISSLFLIIPIDCVNFWLYLVLVRLVEYLLAKIILLFMCSFNLYNEGPSPLVLPRH